MSELSKLRRELTAEFALTWGAWEESNSRIAALSKKLDQQGREIAEQGQRIAEQGQSIAESMQISSQLGMQVVASGEIAAARLRQMEKRFDSVLRAVENETGGREVSKRLKALEKRVRKLEEKSDPAA